MSAAPFLLAGGDPNWVPRVPEPRMKLEFPHLAPKACAWCSKEWVPTRINAHYCSKSCGMRASYARGDVRRGRGPSVLA